MMPFLHNGAVFFTFIILGEVARRSVGQPQRCFGSGQAEVGVRNNCARIGG